MTKKEPTTDACRFNVGVQCERHICDNCGWNPKVEAARKRGTTTASETSEEETHAD